ncbi:MAG: class I SAM-dependent methyltransferase [Phycisphaerales bacterium]|nr:class I SAM-dependent methyltransferase [Phycisphaerales bacterium]
MTGDDRDGCEIPCRVCGEWTLLPFRVIDGQAYWRCHTCRATLLDPANFPSEQVERARYESHRNDPTDPRYRAFLGRLAEPLLARLPAAQCGLDYGCGPGPALAQMLREAGHAMRLWDPFFHPDEGALKCVYDFVTCTETAEHFQHPMKEFSRIDGLLKPRGWLAVMTTFQTDDARFEQWYYRRDPTHVSFYTEFTLQHIARSRGWECEIPAANVSIMRKA